MTGETDTVTTKPVATRPKAGNHYRLELSTGMVIQTGWWKPSEDYSKVPANVWWLYGENNGQVFMSRPANDIEIELWQRLQSALATT